jgi:hypothetical protein
MEVSTSPIRWQELKDDPTQREERWKKTNITLLDYSPGQTSLTRSIKDVDRLKEVLAELPVSHTTPENKQAPLRIFIVEDLSRQVIELLGSRFGVDPLFFREHIECHSWQGVRDPWATTPDLTSNVRRRPWFSVRNLRLRYHRTKASFSKAYSETASWNIKRRCEDDGNYFKYQDHADAVVAMTLTCSTIWVGKDTSWSEAPVGIVLVDPTVTEGCPLWYGRGNWQPMPDHDVLWPVTNDLNSASWFTDIVNATTTFPWFKDTVAPSPTRPNLDLRAVVLPTLYTTCAEWHLVTSYITARLSQIEYTFQGSLQNSAAIDQSLTQLDTWRRCVPLSIESVYDTLKVALPAAKRLTAPNNHDDADDALTDITTDFQEVLRTLTTLSTRIALLSDRLTAEMQLAAARESLAAARESLAESHNLARLTWLATIFVPLTFMSGLFSMTEDLGAITGTFKTYFSAAVPLVIVSLVFARWGGIVWRYMMLLFRMLRKLCALLLANIRVGSVWVGATAETRTH